MRRRSANPEVALTRTARIAYWLAWYGFFGWFTATLLTASLPYLLPAAGNLMLEIGYIEVSRSRSTPLADKYRLFGVLFGFWVLCNGLAIIILAFHVSL